MKPTNFAAAMTEALERVASRVDEKGETIDQAAEAVYPDYGGLYFRRRLIVQARRVANEGRA